jgi:transposase
VATTASRYYLHSVPLIKVTHDKVIYSAKFNTYIIINHLSPELNPICYLLALLVHDFLHVSRIRVKALTLRLLMPYIYIRMTLVT